MISLVQMTKFWVVIVQTFGLIVTYPFFLFEENSVAKI